MRPTGTVLHRDAVLLAVLGQRIRIECGDAALRALLVAMYESMAVPDDGRPADLCYRIDTSGTPAVISISRPALGTFNAHAPEEQVSLLSRDMRLFPGDVIACGTSLGIGSIKDGATVEIDIVGIGTLSNRLTARVTS